MMNRPLRPLLPREIERCEELRGVVAESSIRPQNGQEDGGVSEGAWSAGQGPKVRARGPLAASKLSSALWGLQSSANRAHGSGSQQVLFPKVTKSSSGLVDRAEKREDVKSAAGTGASTAPVNVQEEPANPPLADCSGQTLRGAADQSEPVRWEETPTYRRLISAAQEIGRVASDGRQLLPKEPGSSREGISGGGSAHGPETAREVRRTPALLPSARITGIRRARVRHRKRNAEQGVIQPVNPPGPDRGVGNVDARQSVQQVRQRKRDRACRSPSPRKRNRRATRVPRREEMQAEDLASILQYLEKEFAMKERLSSEQTWCEPIPHERKVSTAERFYKAFHDASTMPIWTCMLCYRKCAKDELKELAYEEWQRWAVDGPVSCRSCFPEGENFPACSECMRCVARGSLSPAVQLHGRLGCEHTFPEELKGLTPIEEKLIAPNASYGFVTRYSIPDGRKQTLKYPRHIKGHITVSPNNVQELAANVLPHPLVRVMDDIHVSWQGAEKPAPSDLSGLLSVRPRVVERALVWLKQHNPHYAGIEIDLAEIESWGSPPHGVPSLVYNRMERNEPSAWEKTRTAQVVPPTERGMDDEGFVDIEDLLTLLNEGQVTSTGYAREPESTLPGAACGEQIVEPDPSMDPINEVTSSGMFPLDGPPDVADVEKLRFACHAVRRDATHGGRAGPRTWVGTNEAGEGAGEVEPYIRVARGEEFADSFDASFFAKTFPTLLPFGVGGPRLAEEAALEAATARAGHAMTDADGTARGLLSSRNLSLRQWAGIVLRRHGGRFATHHIFAFLVFNMGVRSRNRRVSMLSVTRKGFRKVERIVRSLTAERLAAAKAELESSGKTNDDGIKELLKSISMGNGNGNGNGNVLRPGGSPIGPQRYI
ncbi:hypothetical protein Purlil1_6224 [Purpureocillium lilacinum]|uniref:DUF6570 domain-containing protein n=1 Tax=Purpureocillium lilacinum TaxID=33203 RepID=A0ABR0BZ46_PURLI|nr:hypothetical protein Purlil1_6224 [Purpureocillium lilacinum]